MNTATVNRAKAPRQQRSLSYPEPSCTGALTPPPKLEIADLSRRVGQDATLGAAIGYITGPGGLKAGKALMGSFGLTGANVTGNQLARELVMGFPFFIIDIVSGISQHYLRDFLESFGFREKLGFPDFSTMSLSERIAFSMRLDAEIRRIQDALTSFVQGLNCPAR